LRDRFRVQGLEVERFTDSGVRDKPGRWEVEKLRRSETVIANLRFRAASGP